MVAVAGIVATVGIVAIVAVGMAWAGAAAALGGAAFAADGCICVLACAGVVLAHWLPPASAQERGLGAGGELLDGVAAVVNEGVVLKSELGVPTLATGVVVALLTWLVIVGGVKSIGRVAERLAPAKVVLYFAGGVLVLVLHADRLPATLYVEVETNGTLSPEPALAERVDQWNVSPKLSNGGDPESLRIRPAALAALLATERAFLKLVVGSAADVAEAEALVAGTGWPRERVMLMPEAANRAELVERSGFVREAALTRGLRVSPRLHVERWDGARGV